MVYVFFIRIAVLLLSRGVGSVGSVTGEGDFYVWFQAGFLDQVDVWGNVFGVVNELGLGCLRFD